MVTDRGVSLKDISKILIKSGGCTLVFPDGRKEVVEENTPLKAPPLHTSAEDEEIVCLIRYEGIKKITPKSIGETFYTYEKD